MKANPIGMAMLDERPDWNIDWAIVDGAGYYDFVELGSEDIRYVESTKLAVRLHRLPKHILRVLNNWDSIYGKPKDSEFWVNDIDNGKLVRSLVLPDLRSGAGFT